MGFAVAGLMVAALASGPAPVHGQEPVASGPAPVCGQEPVTSPVAISGGFGVSTGLVGGLLARRFGELPLAAVLGLGVEGLVPQLQVDMFTRGSFNVHVGGGVLYNPWGGLVLSPGSVVGLGSAGVQRWPYRWQHGGVFLNADVQLVKQFRGTGESRAECALMLSSTLARESIAVAGIADSRGGEEFQGLPSP